MKRTYRTITVAAVAAILTAGGVVHLSMTANRTAKALNNKGAGGVAILKPAAASVNRAADRKISAQQAVALALNDLRASEDDPNTIELQHPKHSASFSRAEGIRFSPSFSELSWNWKLQHFGGETRNLLTEAEARPQPEKKRASVEFDHGTFTERYLAKENSVEQQFLLAERPSALREGEDLVIRGEMASDGTFDDSRAETHGWVWREAHSDRAVSLGQVTVFDADGKTLPATMIASAETTQITVDGSALASARYPVTVDPEIGTNDFLISEPAIQPDGDVHELPATAYGLGKFCVAWLKGSPVPGDTSQLYVQLVDTSDGTTAETGPQLLGDPVLITHKAVSTRPSVSFDGQHFMVVWNGVRNNIFDTIGRAQVIDRNGNPVLAQPVEVTSSTPFQWNSLSLTAHSRLGSGFVLAWVDSRRAVRFRVLDTEGNTVHSDRLLGVHGHISAPSDVALSSTYLAGGAHCVTWMRSNVETGGRDVVARLVGNNGAMDPNTAIVASGSSNLTAIGVAASNSLIARELAFIWQDRSEPDSDDAIYHRLTNADLTGKTEPTVVSVPENDSQITRPEIVYAQGSQAYVVTWAAHANGELGIRASLVAEQTGDLLTGRFALSHEGSDAAIVISSQSLRPDRLFSVVSRAGDPRADDIGKPLLGYTLEMPNNGFEITSDPPLVFGVPNRVELKATSPSVAYLGWTDHYVVAWEREGNSPEDSEIVIRWVPGDPEVVNPNSAMVISKDSALPALHRVTGSRAPKIAAMPNSENFLVVWQGMTPANVPGPRKTEIYARAWYGHENDWTSTPFQVSDTGRTQEITGGFEATTPDVVYNTEDHRYLVVWSANAESGDAVPGNTEIYARSIEATNQILSPVIRKLSNSAAGQLPAVDPAVAYNATENEYLVVWSGSKADPFTMALKEEEIIGQRLSATAKPIGFPEIRVSTMGPILDTRYGARTPDVAYNPVSNEYLVVWSGEHDVHTNTEIHAQYIRANGTRSGIPRQISNMGMTDDFAAAWVAVSPQVTYEVVDNTFHVVWTSGHVLTGMAIGETEVFIAEVHESGFGPIQQRLSDLGPDGNRDFDANLVAISTDGEGRYLVAFDGNDDQEPLTHDSSAIFGQYFERYSDEPDGGFEVPGPGAGGDTPDKDGDGSDKDTIGEPSTPQGTPTRIETDESGTWLVWEEDLGYRYAVQASTDLQTWKTIAEHEVQGEANPEDQRYFRVLILPIGVD